MTLTRNASQSCRPSSLLENDRLTPFLDDVEEWLPAPADSLFGLQRSMTRLWFNVVSGAVRTVSSSMENVFSTGRTGARTVTGQARSAVERTVETATTGSKEVLGQAKAQAERTVATAESEVDSLADQVETSIPTRNLEDWTRADLYTRAQNLELEGRSSMDKAELITALTAAGAV